MKINLKGILLAFSAILVVGCQEKDNKGNEGGCSVTTIEVTEITAFSAKTGGIVSGSETITERGVCWGISAEPTVDDNNAFDIDPVAGEYTIKIEGLTPQTTYYARAYAKKDNGEVIYGEALPFDTAEVELESESNSYLVEPYATIAIPVSRANKSTLGQQIKADDKLEAELLWMDNMGVVNSIETYGDGENGCVVVYAGGTDGNALVTVKVNDEVKWSWHIWVSQSANAITTIELPSGAKIMDRNLGAISKTISEIGAVGLQYQFGRKDPFTASASFGTPAEVLKYDLEGNNPEIVLADGPKSLAFAVANPDTYIKSNYCDWCDENVLTWWSDESGAKTIYDPCPEGWRVPSIDDYAGIAQEHFNDVEGGNMYVYNEQSNFFPFTGYREVTGLMDATANYGTLWVNAVIDGAQGEASALSPSYGLGGVQAVNGSPRSRALSIRCVKEQ